ncbi:MAG: hypothetical protein HYZ39_19190 [Mycolicibacterium cosmeticum]|nr:hypothetical protein [Mycolicibacterium cosmeticum]
MMFVVYQGWQHWRTDQASQIYAWLARKGDSADVCLGNGSGLPVYDIFVYLPPVSNYLQTGLKHRMFYRFMRWELLEIALIGQRIQGEGHEPGFHPDYTPSALRMLPPGPHLLDGHSMGPLPGIPDVTLYFGIEIVFRDARGVRWARRSSGKLKRSRINPHWFHGTRIRYAAERGGSPFSTISRIQDQ